MRLINQHEARFLLRSAIADYDANRIDEARKKFLDLVSSSAHSDPEVFEYLYLIAKYEEPTDLTAAGVWQGRFVDGVKRLAEEGSAKWQLKLATMHQFGDRVEVDASYALETFARLAQTGNAEAQYRYAVMHKHGHCGISADQAVYVQWLVSAADNGFSEAEHELALLLLSGEQVTPADRAKALVLLHRASDGGWAQAKVDLADLEKPSG